ncbi:MAG TPA: class I SAM-dependent methyltransferase [Thermoanaerobaculia bacterium]|jgi:SAM-dependent methyltransferase
MDENAPYQYFEDVNWGLLRLWGKRKGLRVLDVGCGFATTSARIQQLGNEVTGIESSAEACAVARTRLSHVIEADLVNATPDATYDAIIFADVLEHLPWPMGVLQRYLGSLAPNGSVIVSLPNVGLWSVRFAHLFGQWNYEETGVLDRTHLRFFTRRTARWLIEQSGLRIETTTYNPGLVRPLVPLAKKVLRRAAPAQDDTMAPDALLNSKPYKLYLKTAYPIERAVASLWPGMLAFQMIFEARK